MFYFDKYPNQFRLLFGILASYLFVVAAINFYRFSSSPTDENLFTNPPTDLYITKNFPAAQGTKNDGSQSSDSVHVGDVLLSIDRHKVETEEDVDSLIALSTASTVTLEVRRLEMRKNYKFLVAKASFPNEFVRTLGPTAYVVNVTQGGASDRAGMKVGDLIIRINGERFKNANDADRVMRQAQVGKSIAYEVIRNNETLTLHVTLATFGIQIGILIFILAGVVYMGTGVFIGLSRPRFVAARIGSLSFIALGFFIMTLLNRRDLTQDVFAVIRNGTLILSVFFAISFTLHSGMYFPKERPELIAKRWIRIVPYGAAIAFTILTIITNNVGFFAGLIFLIGYTVVIQILYRKQASDEYKKLNRPGRLTGMFVGITASALGIYITATQSPQLLWIFGIILTLVPAAQFYTIGRYRLLDLDLRVRRNIQYVIVSLLWLLVLIVVALKVLLVMPETYLPLPNIRLTATSIEVLDAPLDPATRELTEKVVLMFLAIGLAVIAWKVGQKVQQFIDKKFYRAQYDYRRAASELAEVMATKLTMADLGRGMVEKLTELIQLKRAGVLFFRGQKECCCQEAQGFDGADWKNYCLRTGDDLVKAIQQFQGEFSVDYLPAGIKEQFRKNKFLYIVPIRSKDTLVGAILVGEKLSEATYQHEDLEFLAAVAKQASVAIENAFLYEELAEQERMKHELAIARRIQMASLPQRTPAIDGLDIAGTSIPALEVGGDYFDYLNGEERKLTVIVGDVSGKGTSAALYMSRVQGILRSLHAFGLSPRDLFIRTNKLLWNDIEKKSFVTVIGGFFDASQRQLILARAGHLPLYYYNAKSRSVETIIPKGIGLGLEAEKLFSSELEERIIVYNPNDVFVFISDGITEAQKSDGAQFGEENLMKQLDMHSHQSAEQIRDKIITAVTNFVGGNEQHDDQTIVVVKAV